MSINWLNTFKKKFTELAFYIFTFVLYSFLKIFLPFFSFNLKATFKEELYQKFYHRHYGVAFSIRWATWTHAKHYSTLKYSILFIRFYCLKDLAKIVYIKTFLLENSFLVYIDCGSKQEIRVRKDKSCCCRPKWSPSIVTAVIATITVWKKGTMKDFIWSYRREKNRGL